MGWIILIIIVIVIYFFGKSNSQRGKYITTVKRTPHKYPKNHFERERYSSGEKERKKRSPGVLPDFIEGIVISEEYKTAFNIIENTTDNVFITGKAGTGKSTFLELLKNYTTKICAVVAPSGIAALNVNGKTIHSFFGFNWGIIQEKDIKKVGRPEVYKCLELLIIDEISMVRVDLFEAMDRFLRINRNCPEKPFGGVQVVMIGDLYQLPPIVKKKGEADYFSNHYNSRYFFSTNIFKAMNIKIFNFQQVYRQEDISFIEILDRIRNDTITRKELTDLNRFHVNNEISQNKIVITPTNRIANYINDKKLEEIKSPSCKYYGVVTGNFDNDESPAPMELILKRGAQVIFVKNDINKRWVNGTIGIIEELTIDKIVVNVGAYYYEIGKEKWETYHYEFDPIESNLEKIVDGSYEQYPLRLAWAITVHRSQGKTFDNVLFDVGNGAFEFGLVYVALSRCRTPKGLKFAKEINISDIKKDEKIDIFINNLT